MPVETPPWAIQGQSHAAERARNHTAALLGTPAAAVVEAAQITTAGGSHGVSLPGDLAVTQNGTPNMSVNVAAGRAFIRSTETASLNAGVYSFFNDGTVNLAIAAADPTNGRRDLVVAQVRDSNYSGAANDARLFVVTGIPAGVPVDPAIPDSCLVLARVTVGAGVTSIVNANITDLRTRAYSLGGQAVANSTVRPSGVSLYDGLNLYEPDTHESLVYYATPAQWRRPWRMPWGRIGSAVTTGTNQTGITSTVADITGLSVTWTAVANRRYRVTVNVSVQQVTSAATHEIIIANASNTILRQRSTTLATNDLACIAIVHELNGVAAGSFTVKARAGTGAGTLTIINDFTRNGEIIVEDIGPNGAPA
jgi:hypothetical protein